MSSSFGLRAARALIQWRTKYSRCCDQCPSVATRMREETYPMPTRGARIHFRCDRHSDALRYTDLPDAQLIRETGAIIEEANQRPSCRALPVGEGK